jgi:predicted nucleotidyltransferase
MKTIQSSLVGNKSIAATDPQVQLFQVREVLNLHRDTLINRVLSDLPTYVDYKFKARPSIHELLSIKEQLLNVTRTNVDLDRFKPVVKQIRKKATTRLTNELFFSEIDSLIRRQINKSQLQLMA